MGLTDDQVTAFEERGVVVAEGILTDSDLAPVIDAVCEFLDHRARELQAAGKIETLYEDEPFLTRYARLYAQSPEIGHGIDIMQMRAKPVFDFLRNDYLLDAVESLVGSEITCSPIQHIRAKPPSRLTEGPDFHHNVPWHQDSGVTWEEADQAKIITCWLPLVDATIERGCMQVMPDVFRNGHLTHYSAGATTIRPEFLPKVTPQPLEVKKGDVAFLNQFTPHHSTPNRTQWDVRWSMDLRYQPYGSPTGRPFHPDFCVRSRIHSERILTDHQQWCAMWIEAMEEQKRNPQKAHRV